MGHKVIFGTLVSLLAVAVASAQGVAAPQEQFDAGAQHIKRYLREGRNPAEFEAAERLFRAAAEQGHADARYNLGVFYNDGVGVAQDYALAAHWFEFGAIKGHAPSQFSLALLLEKGRGVAQDFERAADLYRLAAEQGIAKASYRLASMFMRGDGKLARDPGRAARWYRKSANAGYDAAQYNLGVMYYQGVGVDKNIRLARDWLARAAAQGNQRATSALQTIVE